MDTVKALEQQNALMKERWEYWKEQTQTTKTAKADKAEVRKLIWQRPGRSSRNPLCIRMAAVRNPTRATR